MNGPVIALTGATGFIGRRLLALLPGQGYRLRVLLRRPGEIPAEAAGAAIGDLARPHNLAEALRGADVVVHSAGLAHAMSGRPEDDFRAINTEGTLALARAAERVGVRRFVFLSSIRAQSGPVAEGVLTEAMDPAPTDAYGRSKLAAEQGLADLALDWVALRPVLVYGEGVKGNMAALVRLARRPWPLPLGGLTGRRSLLQVDDLVSAIDAVIRAPHPLRRALVVAHPDPLTVPEMIAALRSGWGRGPGLVPVPEPLLALAARLAGREEAYRRLAGSLVADPQALIRLGWAPRVAPRPGLAALARSSAPDA